MLNVPRNPSYIKTKNTNYLSNPSMQEDLSESEASLVYIVNYRPAKVTEWDPVSKNKRKFKNRSRFQAKIILNRNLLWGPVHLFSVHWAHVSRSCGGQRAICGNRFFFPCTMWALTTDSVLQSWREAPLAAQPSCRTPDRVPSIWTISMMSLGRSRALCHGAPATYLPERLRQEDHLRPAWAKS